jgi:hypothetical protein
MRAFLAVMVMAGLVWVAAPAGADAPKTMGEAAAKEKDKKKPAKVYTEDDLRNRKGGSGSYSQPAAEGGTSAAAAGDKKAEGDKKVAGDKAGEKKEKTPDEERAERQADWHKRLDQAQKDVGTWSADVDRIQAVLNDSTQPQYGAGRAAKVEALETAKKNLAAANQTLSDLQEEGRRNGYR